MMRCPALVVLAVPASLLAASCAHAEHDTFADRLVEAAMARLEHDVRYDGSYRIIDYPNGDVPANVGVCTDVVIRAYRELGIDLQRLVHEDMSAAFDAYPKIWGLTSPDPNIDHRRVPNLQTFFERQGASLPLSERAADYEPGDLVSWMLPNGRPHIGIVVAQRSPRARRPLIVHNIGAGPKLEDVLFDYEITGHYRFTGSLHKVETPSSARSRRVIARVEARMQAELHRAGLELGSPVFIRIFKKSRELELWVRAEERFELFKIYKVCSYSGDLGPKRRRGDRQSPEGFYFVTPARMNPSSRFHLSFNLGYPNAYDRAHGRTGDFLMVHGSCISIGCYAMTDRRIEEIYTVADAALRAGQPFFRVHVFPFRMTDQAMEKHLDSRWGDFWRNLKEGYDWFEERGRPPDVEVAERKYVFADPDLPETSGGSLSKAD